MVADPVTGREAGKLTLRASEDIGGIATSGRHGRSLSLGIADAVTVLAENAAAADVAATLIANEVDLPGHPAIHRAPATKVDPDSDLRDRPVVVEVETLSDGEVREALERGLNAAEEMVAAGLIRSANLSLIGISKSTRTVIPALCRDPEQRLHSDLSIVISHEGRNRTPAQGRGDTMEQEARHALT